ncbi:MAG TPA: pseudouridine synthase [Thermodesulfovibrionales bacterium]|nr:pseudouridine synthase [Thermodesulfovibrionales bacterium]
MEKRLQKILSEMGIASRRESEELILEGRIKVNGKIAEIGMKADPQRDHIKVDGKLLTKREPKTYLLFNKPRNVVTTLKDPEGRPTVKDFLKDMKYRVYPVGRLDFDSEGLLLLTNDGDFANAIMHPSKKIAKTYEVKVKGVPEQQVLEKLKRGIRLEDGMTSPAKIKGPKTTENNSWLEVTIYEGRKRQLRRMFDQVGHSVLKLKRIRIGGIQIGDLAPGRYRHLTPDELNRIKQAFSQE